MLSTRKNNTTLKLTILPLSNWLIGLGLLVFMTFITFFMFGGGGSLVCSRINNTNGNCTLKYGGYSKSFVASDLLGAQVVRHGSMFSAKIATKNEDLPFGGVSTSSYSPVNKVVFMINKFAKDKNVQHLKVTNSYNSMIEMLFSSMFYLFALCLILSGRIVILDLDKNRDNLTIRWIGIIPRQPFSCRLSNVSKVKCVRVSTGRAYSNNYIDIFEMKDGEEIPISNSARGWFGTRSIANKINFFLGI